jgi:hypothetical protein
MPNLGGGSVSVNLARRNLTKGQQAMALAMVYPEPEKGGRGKNIAARKTQETLGFTSERLRQARKVLRTSPALGKEVLLGQRTLDQARNLAESANFSYRRLNEARTVLHHSEALAKGSRRWDTQ